MAAAGAAATDRHAFTKTIFAAAAATLLLLPSAPKCRPELENEEHP
eukprot:COSAG01_NODE_60395_length_295_cov_0.663265_1_plen_45_part_01